MNVHRTVSRTFLAGLLLAAAGSAFAAEDPWVALLDYDDGVEAYSVRIVAATENECIARASMYRGAEVISPCQPTPSAITDPKEDKRTSKTPRPKQPKLYDM